MEELAGFVSERLEKKMIDSNKIRISAADPHQREANVDSIHGECVRTVFPRLPLSSNTMDFDYRFNLLDDVSQHFGWKSLVRFWNSGDISLVAPWAVLTRQFVPKDDKKPPCDEFVRGRLVMPLNTNGRTTTCFVPCHADPDSDDFKPPAWAKEIDVDYLVPEISYPEVTALRKTAPHVTEGKAGTDFIYVSEGAAAKDDYVIVINKTYQVREVSKNAFAPENAVATVDAAHLCSKLKNNFRPRKFDVIKPPTIKGTFANFPNSALKSHADVTLAFRSGKYNVGTIKVSYQNFLFNCLGYVTLETHVAL